MCLHTLIGPNVQPDVLATSYYPQACRDPRGGGGIGVERWGYGISMYLWRRVSHGNLCVNLNTAMVV